MRQRTDTEPGWVNRRFARLEQQIREMRAARELENATVSKGRTTFAAGSTLEVSGVADFADGIIDTDALSSAVAAGFVYLDVFAFALSATPVALIDTLVTVPDGFTSAVVNANGRVFAYNTTAVADHLYAQVWINDAFGNALPIPAEPAGTHGDAPFNVSPFSTVLSDLVAGTTFGLQLFAWTAAGSWTAVADNTAELTGSVLWFR